jgi:Protein of unknown function (DUF3099).
LAGAVVLPYVSVVFANGGREPENTPTLSSGTWDEPARDQNFRANSGNPVVTFS